MLARLARARVRYEAVPLVLSRRGDDEAMTTTKVPVINGEHECPFCGRSIRVTDGPDPQHWAVMSHELPECAEFVQAMRALGATPNASESEAT
jgi:hypothetical protein